MSRPSPAPVLHRSHPARPVWPGSSLPLAAALVCWLPPARGATEARRLSFADAQLGLAIVPVAVLLLVSYVLSGLSHVAVSAAT